MEKEQTESRSKETRWSVNFELIKKEGVRENTRIQVQDESMNFYFDRYPVNERPLSGPKMLAKYLLKFCFFLGVVASVIEICSFLGR